MNLRQVRKKIKTIGNVSKITKAMQMVAAVKMKKAQQKALEGRIYRDLLTVIARRVMLSSEAEQTLSLWLKKEKKTGSTSPRQLFIFIASNKGLCGSFNVNLCRFLARHSDFDRDHFITVGKKGVSFIVRMGGQIIADFSQSSLTEIVSPIFSLIMEHLTKQTYQKTILIYNKFISTFKIAPINLQLLPLEPAEELTQAQVKEQKDKLYLIEPSYSALLEALFQDFLKEKIKTALLDSEAGEQAARMVAMKNATDSAAEITYNLTLLRNKLRQQGITYELLDMIAAKEST